VRLETPIANVTEGQRRNRTRGTASGGGLDEEGSCLVVCRRSRSMLLRTAADVEDRRLWIMLRLAAASTTDNVDVRAENELLASIRIRHHSAASLLWLLLQRGR